MSLAWRTETSAGRTRRYRQGPPRLRGLHAVVPVAGAHQRQAVRAEQREGSVPVRARNARRAARCSPKRSAPGKRHARLRPTDGRRETARPRRKSPCRRSPPHSASHRIGQPRAVVGNMRAYARAALWQPPVLHVTLRKLACGRPQQMLAGRQLRDAPRRAPCRPATDLRSRTRRLPSIKSSARAQIRHASVWYSNQRLSIRSIVRSGVTT